MDKRSGQSRRLFLGQATAAVAAAAGWQSLLPAAQPAKVAGTLERLARNIAAAPLSMRFQGSTADECRQWQQQFKAKLDELLGPYQPPQRWKTVVRSAVELDGYRREDLVLEADGCPPLPVYLLLPRPKGARRCAGVLALHGHGPSGHHAVAGRDDMPEVARSIASVNYDYGRQFARRGYAVAVPCFTPFGERLGSKPDGMKDLCGDTFIRLQMLGRLLIAENLRDSLWALEFLCSREEVDAERLGCAGLSYGGRMTMLTAAVEPRIGVAAVSGALNMMQERIRKPYDCGAQIIPGLLQYGDNAEISSLIAPRHLVWEVGSRDTLLPADWAAEFLGRVGRAYAALGAPERMLVDRFEGGHSWNGQVAFPLFDKVLKSSPA